MAGRLYRFGSFEVDEARLELRRGGDRVDIQPKPLDLLLYLLRHRERVVSKEELLDRLWPGVAVTEASLSKAVSAVRRALGVAESGGPIETVRGRGFCFAAAVEENAAGRGPVAPHGEGAFVGREDVLETVAAALASARTGTGRLILLAGPAGMGKTRVALESAARARAAGVSVLATWCSEGGETPDLWPWFHVLRQLLGACDPAPLVHGLGDVVADLAEHLPLLAAHRPAGVRDARLEPEHARFRLLEAIVALLTRAARGEPWLVVLDDAHWADRDSLAVLGLLARSLAGARVALLVAYRQEELADAHPLLALGRAPASTTLELAALEAAHVARLVEAELGEAPSTALTSAIYGRTEGNPYFVKELARALRAHGHPYDVATLADVPLSAGIHHVLHARLARLSPACRDLLALCAVLGAEVELVPVACASGQPAAAVLRLLDEARAAHLVQERDDRWRFAHALVRDVLLERLPAAERARHHRRVGIALEDHYRHDPEPHLGELAHHFTAGAADGDVERAARYARLAGERAARLLAYSEAAEHYQRALRVSALGKAPEERATADLLLSLGEALMFSGQPDAGRETLARAADAARRFGSSTHLARAALASGGLELSGEVGYGSPAVRALFEEALAALPSDTSLLGVRLLARLAVMSLATENRHRERLVERAMAAARDLGDPVALCYALYGRHWASLGPVGDLAQQLAGADEMLALAAVAHRRELELTARSLRFLVLLELGRIAEAELELDAYEALVARVSVPRYRWRAGFYRTTLALLRGRFAEVPERVQRTLEEETRFRPADFSVGQTQLFWLLREQARTAEIEPTLRTLPARFPSLTSAWRVMLALLLAETGREAEARALIDILAEDDFNALSRSFLWLPALALLGDACALVGDVSRATRIYALLEPYRPRAIVLSAGTYCLGSIDLTLGRLAAAAGHAEVARRHLEAALAMNTQIGAQPWVAWTDLELSRLLAQTDAGRARRHLDRARTAADALGMIRLAQRCAA